MQFYFIIKYYILLFFTIININETVKWLSVGVGSEDHPIILRSANECKNIKGLTKKQIKFCKKNLDAMTSVARGAIEAYSECQYQFKGRRWNCSLIDPETKEVFPEVILNNAIRETAFVHAVSAAGVAYRITRDCSKGLMDRCGCDMSQKGKESINYYNTDQVNDKGLPIPNINSGEGYSWRGCSDNVQYGIGVSKEFVDGGEKGRNLSSQQVIMNLHNNRAGRQILVDSMRKMCKCHGVSGSCEMKTCWQSLPTFREIGNIIKDKFDGATEVRVSREANKYKLIRKNPMFKRHTSVDLVYIQQSPDFCNPNPSQGVFGTAGRVCNITSQSVDGCDLLCCGRGYDRKVEIKEEMCNCKFHFCCKVECQKCKRTREVYTCR
ncbi:Protein Wnt-4 [Strongyloides ratti]|uniref:Protein Wnt n=1 Tax=Strongyloides ratti TaxID=34506 RepID=A0A090LRF9_STRRB|nr:Protein Wnt-4 [Strongyloides ratti]CEF70727.1 Protein Wnt-4 [Strongyloides ratti]